MNIFKRYLLFDMLIVLSYGDKLGFKKMFLGMRLVLDSDEMPDALQPQ